MKIYCWTVHGIKAVLDRGFLEWLETESPDILVVMRTMSQPESFPDELYDIPGYHTFWDFSENSRKGGIGLLSKNKPSSKPLLQSGIAAVDREARTVIVEYDEFALILCDFMIDRLFYSHFDQVMSQADDFQGRGKPVIIGGDIRGAHSYKDTSWPPSTYKKFAYRIECFLEAGYLDIWRELYPDTEGVYTYWDGGSLRDANEGSRWERFFISPDLLDSVVAAEIHDDNRMSIMQCPISLTLSFEPQLLMLPESATIHRVKHPKRLPDLQGDLGYVYVLQDTQCTGYCKIGMTNKPSRRLGQLDLVIPFETEHILTIETPNYKSLEKSLHDRYAEVHIKGEWFALTEEHLAEIKSIGN